MLATLILSACGSGEPEDALESGLAEAAELLDAGDVDGAINRLETLDSEHPGAPEVDEALAFAYVEAGDHQLAALYFERL
ncbi:MAG: tetratricopeptide repeat protein, partial [Opitutales bacterium]